MSEGFFCGRYQYRFSKIPKNLIHLTTYLQFGGCAMDPVANTLNLLKIETELKIERMQVISSQPERAEVRLTTALPEEIQVINPFITIGCNDPSPLDHLAWRTASRPSTEWQQIRLSNTKTLVVRYPAELQDATLKFVRID